MKKDNLTKVVATIGPASENIETLEAMIESGMDIARLNFSHGSHDWHEQAILNLRHAAYRTGKSVGIMADLQGPRVRISELKDKNNKVSELEFKKGEKVYLVEGRLEGDLKKQIRLDCDVMLIKHLKNGDSVFLDNGMVELRSLKKISEKRWEMSVKNNGLIKIRKGINFPTLAKFIPSFTKKDQKDLEFAVKKGLDFIALSFVKNAKDIVSLQKRITKILGKTTGHPWIVAKIETLEALHNLKDILKVVDVIMVARGDLGVEAPPEKVPVYQKLLLRHCLRSGVPAIVATNMLESMVDSPRPTRAELTDVANAVIDRTDAVMLSGESASGKYPILSVQMMEKIIKVTEKSPYDDLNRVKELETRRNLPQKNLLQMTAQAIFRLALESKPDGIVLEETPVLFVKHLASLRPNTPVYCFMGSHSPLSRKLLVCWGVLPFPLRTAFNEEISGLKHLIYVKAEKDKKTGWKFKVKIENQNINIGI